MSKERSYRKHNNTTAGDKTQKKGVVAAHKNPQLFTALDEVYKQYEGPHVETVVVKTFLNVNQVEFSEGDEIPLDRSSMFQKVQLISYDNDK